MIAHYDGQPAVQFVVLQTVFEGFETNTAARAKATAEKFALQVPVGHDPGSEGKRSNVLTRYETRGTPWVLVIDPKGVVRFSDFLIPDEDAIALIDTLAKDATAGLAMFGKRFPEVDASMWLRSRKPDFADHPATIVRWWTPGDADDAASLKALRSLHGKLRSKKLRLVVAVRAPAGEFEAALAKLKWKGEVLRDDGELHRRLCDAGCQKAFQSPTVLVGRDGRILWASSVPRVVPGKKEDSAVRKAWTELEALSRRTVQADK